MVLHVKIVVLETTGSSSRRCAALTLAEGDRPWSLSWAGRPPGEGHAGHDPTKIWRKDSEAMQHGRFSMVLLGAGLPNSCIRNGATAGCRPDDLHDAHGNTVTPGQTTCRGRERGFFTCC